MTILPFHTKQQIMTKVKTTPVAFWNQRMMTMDKKMNLYLHQKIRITRYLDPRKTQPRQGKSPHPN